MARLIVLLSVLVGLAVVFVACGNASTPRHLLSATVTPATATAAAFPGGMVQFTANGVYDHAPSPAQITAAVWDIEPSASYPTDAASVSNAGVAQCKSGFAGTVTVRGGGLSCPDNSMLGVPCTEVLGRAQLTCP